MKINKPDLEKYCYTLQCKGCEAVKYEWSRKPHSNACRERIEKCINEDATARGVEGRARAAKRRKEEALDHHLAREEQRLRAEALAGCAGAPGPVAVPEQAQDETKLETAAGNGAARSAAATPSGKR